MAKPLRSLLVPCVQELVRKSQNVVPPRYMRLDQDNPIRTNGAHDIPIINMKSLISGDHRELKKLDSACRDWGFFQLTNHGVNTSLLEKIKMETQQFFNLPVEEKNKLSMKPDCIEGFGQHFVVSEDQKLEWADIFFLRTLPKHLRKPHLFPHLPLPFRGSLDVYTAELEHLSMKITNCMATALEMDPQDMKDLFQEGMQSMRINYYPPCPQPDKVIGITPHSDIGALTILLQLNETEGFQVKKDEVWVPIKPLPGAFIINIGDTMEMVTNGAYRSIEHRAVVDPSKERLSIAIFHNARLDAEMGPAPSLITEEKPALFRRIGVREFLKGIFARKLHEKSYLDTMRIQSKNYDC